MFTNPNPNCDKKCRFLESMRTSTSVHYPPIYDKNGNNTNPDGNVTTWYISCETCNKHWNATQQYGETTVTLSFFD